MSITKANLDKWCAMAPEEVVNHPDKKVSEIKVRDTKAEIFEVIGNMMAEEVIANNKAGKPTRWVIGASPLEQNDTFFKRVNTERISLKNLYIFHMDEWLDWQTRYYPYADNYYSLRGEMDKSYYAKIDPELTVPIDQRIWPDLSDLDAFDRKVEELGGLDTVWAGIGCKGLVAFNERPQGIGERLTLDDYANSKTRIVKITDETIIALSHRSWGGNYDMVPPMAITCGFKSMLNTKRAVFMITTGAWKQTVVRVLAFSEPTLEYPATLFTDRVPECILCCDAFTLDHPMTHKEFV